MSKGDALQLNDGEVGSFADNELLRNMATVAGLTPARRAVLRSFGLAHPHIAADSFAALLDALALPGIDSHRVSRLLPMADNFKPMIESMVDRLFRAEISATDLVTITSNARSIEVFGIEPEIQFGCYAAVHAYISGVVRGEFSPVAADELISAMAGFWLLSGALFTSAFVEAREARLGELVKVAEQLSLEALSDPLTGLLQRRALLNFRTEDPRDPESVNLPTAVLFVDLDGFKPVNDRFGHQGGDDVLIEVSRRIQGVTRTGDVAVRFGGDEFVLVLANSSRDRAIRVAERIVSAVFEPQNVGGSSIRVSCSAGVAMIDKESTIHHGVALADAAAYEAKRGGGNRVVVHTPGGVR